ncbi:MAG: DEAD/DEAH box helicase family protein [Pseudomonadota bacterium]|nr:DEAD/DEAH box helicase family protein [Pseudomonadota bacterium]
MLSLKNYQRACIDELRTFAKKVGEHNPKVAFYMQREMVYQPVPGLPDVPYVCIRVPTGGGKTLLACHAVDVMASEYIRRDPVLCLWLVPSNTILDQTLKALQDTSHPYRQVLDARFGGRVTVMSLADALYVQRGTLDTDTVIIVSTLAALRVENKEGRKIYETAGALLPHFSGLPPALEASVANADGTITYSLANVLKLRKPIVIVDEAHNARTNLSFEALARFGPSCLIEFTATPQLKNDQSRGVLASNVLTQVSAAQLKAEEMIKLPIRLLMNSDWHETLALAVQKQRELDAIAQKELDATGEYIRPIVLIQAQSRLKGEERLTADVIKETLQNDLKVGADEIAIVTGEVRELDDVDLFSPKCKINFVITQQALKEGWDCSFAYVLCSVADVSSSRDVEQFLGRILRLPRAKSKQNEELNCAYAIVSSKQTNNTMNALAEALIENGFQRIEAAEFIRPEEQGKLPFNYTPLFGGNPTLETVDETPNLSILPENLKERVRFDPGSKTLAVTGNISDADQNALAECFKGEESKKAVRRLVARSRSAAKVAADVRVPALCVDVQGKLEWFETSHFREALWPLATCDANLDESLYPSTRGGLEEALVDITADGRVRYEFIADVRQKLGLLFAEPQWSVAALVNWIDRSVDHPDVTQTQSTLFIKSVIDGLMSSRGVELGQLARDKYRLRNAVSALIARHRRDTSNAGWQRSLFGAQALPVITSAEAPILLKQATYAPSWYYDGGFRFRKHAFPTIGELKADGEEFECAQFLDKLDETARWVRNLERRPNESFWLQTATDRFYPDFVVELTDGRILVVEYKGGDRWSNDDSKEKRALGELWADRSGGRCLFVMPNGTDLAAIRKAIAG